MKKILFLFCTLFFITSCQYEFIELETPPVIDPTEDVSFANEIVPIFTNNNNCTACHTTGKTAPDLTAANAYQSLVGGGLVVSNDPAASKIYTYAHPDESTHRWKVLSAYQAELLSTWINQGIKNN